MAFSCARAWASSYEPAKDPFQNTGQKLGKEVLNFASPKAYSYFVSAKDTHKAFQALQILLHGTSMEFCRNYVTWCTKSKGLISATGFLEWMAENENETCNLVYQLIFNLHWRCTYKK